VRVTEPLQLEETPVKVHVALVLAPETVGDAQLPDPLPVMERLSEELSLMAIVMATV